MKSLLVVFAMLVGTQSYAMMNCGSGGPGANESCAVCGTESSCTGGGCQWGTNTQKCENKPAQPEGLSTNLHSGSGGLKPLKVQGRK